MNKSKQLIIVYLSNEACLDYSILMNQALYEFRPLTIINNVNKKHFSGKIVTLKIPRTSIVSLLALPFLMIALLYQLLLARITRGRSLIYFPAYHIMNVYVILVSKLFGHRTMTTVHDFITHAGEKSKFIESIQKLCIRMSTSVLTLSDFVRNQLLEDHIPSKKLYMLLHPVPETVALNSLPHASEMKMLFFGRIVDYKGLNILVQALENCSYEQLTIAGKGKLPTALITSGKINLINRRLSMDEIQELFLSHHVLLLPYREATQSGVLSLGLAFNINMIISKRGALEEQIPEQAAIWIDPDASALSDAIKKLSADESLYMSQKQNMKIFRNEFQKSWITDCRNLFQDLLLKSN